MQKMTMTKKLWGSLGIIWVAMLVLVGWGAWETRLTMLEERRNAMGDYVDMAINVIGDHAERSERGELPPAEAQRRAASAVREMTYDQGRGYLYIFNGDYELLAHPRLPVGTSVADFQNEEGRYLFREFVEDVRTDDGVVDYLWAHASDEDALAEKSSLNVLFEAASAQGNVGLSTGLTAPALGGGAKAVLMGLMWAGRLEIFPVLLLAAYVLGQR